MKKAAEEKQQIEFRNAEELREWLKEHHLQTESIWAVRWKKNSGGPILTYDEIVEQVLCFGWIDSLPRKLDEERTMLLLSPRSPNSAWSKVNKERVKKLEDLNLIEPSGWKAIELAKNNGQWTLLDEVEEGLIPLDLQAALTEYPPAKSNFANFPPSTRKGILQWIVLAKTPKTRAKRIDETAKKAQINQRANEYIRK